MRISKSACRISVPALEPPAPLLLLVLPPAPALPLLLLLLVLPLAPALPPAPAPPLLDADCVPVEPFDVSPESQAIGAAAAEKIPSPKAIRDTLRMFMRVFNRNGPGESRHE